MMDGPLILNWLQPVFEMLAKWGRGILDLCWAVRLLHFTPWVSRNSCTRLVPGSCSHTSKCSMLIGQYMPGWRTGPPAIVWRDNHSFVTSHPGTQRVQEFLLTQGVYRQETINSLVCFSTNGCKIDLSEEKNAPSIILFFCSPWLAPACNSSKHAVLALLGLANQLPLV